MIPVSEKYKQTLSQFLRPASRFKAELEISDSDIPYTTALTESSRTDFSKSVWDSVHECDYATFEPDFMKVGSGLFIVPDKQSDILKNGYVSEAICDENGVFDSGQGNIPTISFVFDKPRSFPGITYDFIKTAPKEVRVTAYTEDVQLHQHIFEPTGLSCADETVLPSCEKLIIEFLSMKEPERRLRISRLLLGIVVTFENSDILSSRQTVFVDPVSSSLPYNKLSMTVENFDKTYNPDNPSGKWEYIHNGQLLRLKYGVGEENEVEWLDKAQLYLSDAPTASSNQAVFEAQDIISTLTGTYYKGVYKSAGASLYDLAVDVLRNAGIYRYSIPEELKKIKTKAPLPVLSHRELLQIIANAGRCVLYAANDGTVTMKLQIDSDVSLSDNGHTSFSSLASAYNGGIENQRYASFELCGMKLGSNIILPDGKNYLPTGFTGDSLSIADGTFSVNPVCVINYSLPVSSHGFSVTFDTVNGVYAKDFNLTFFNGNTVVYSENVRDNKDLEYTIDAFIEDYTKVTIEIIRLNRPFNRVKIGRIGQGRLSDFYLDFDTALEKPTLTRRTALKSVDVAVHKVSVKSESESLYKLENTPVYGNMTYEISYNAAADISLSVSGATIVISQLYAQYGIVTVNGNGTMSLEITGKPLLVDDSVKTVINGIDGENCPFDNPLITDDETAENVGKWLSNYLRCRDSYETSFRQDFRLDGNDLIYFRSEFAEYLPVRITKLEFNIPGQRGTIAVRRLDDGRMEST